MGKLAAQLDASQRHRGQAAPGGHVTNNSPIPGTAWRSRPVRLVIFCGILLIVAIAVGTGIMLSNLRNRALTENEREIQNIALVLAKQMERDFDAVVSVQTSLIERIQALGIASSEDFERKMSNYDTHLLLKDKVVGFNYLGALILVNSQGRTFNFSRSWPNFDTSVADRDYFTALQSDENLNLVVGKPIQSRATGTWIAQIARKVSGPKGEFLGLVLGAIELQSIEQYFARVALGSDSAISLLHRDGDLMARHPHIKSAIGRPIPGGLAVKLVSSSDSGVGRRIGAIGNAEDRLIAAHRVAHYPFLIAVTTNVAAVLADWWRATFYLIGIAALAILIVAAGTFLVIRQFKNYAVLERARAEKIEAEILREQTLRLDTALNNMTHGLVMYDAAYRIVVCNRQYIEMYGLSPGVVKPGCEFRELIGHRKARGSFIGDVDEYCAKILAGVATGNTLEHVTETPDGRIIQIINRPMENGGRVSMHLDITERRRAERNLQQREQELRTQNIRFETALDNMSQGLIMFDSEGRLVVCNDRYRQMCGLTPDMVRPGCTFLDILKYRAANGSFSGNAEKYVGNLLAAIAQGATVKNELETADGRIIQVVNLPMAGGGWVATHEDVTERKQAQALIEESHKNLERAESMARLGHYKFEQGATAVTWSEGLYRIVGRSPESFTPTLSSVLELVHPDDRLALERYRRDTMAGLDLPSVTLRLLKDDGQLIYVENSAKPLRASDGSVIGMFGTLQDITEAKRQEASFRLLFKNNPVPMWVFDRDSLRFLAVNEAAVTHYGYSHEQFQAMTVMDIRPPEERERFAKYANLVGEDHHGEQIWRHQKADKTQIDVAIYSRALSYDGYKATLVASIDVTDRKRAEDELRRTQNFLNTVVENVPLPIVVKSVPSGVEDANERRFTLVNRAAENFFGVSRDQMIGKSPHEIYSKDRADFIVGIDSEALRASHPTLVREHQVKNSYNDIRIVTSRKVAIRDENGKPEYLLSLLDDVTERKHAADELRRTQIFLDTIIENMPTPIIVKDVHDFRYTLINRATEECFGVSRNAMIGKNVHEIFGKEEADAVIANDKAALRSDRPLFTDTYPLHTPHNGDRLLTAKRLAIRDHSGNPQYLLTVLDDVTERRRAEQRTLHMALYDELTDLPNRANFSDTMNTTLERAALTGKQFAILSIDLDHFKEANDTYGHLFGDALLREVARCMQAAAGDVFLARIGGDEFALIVADGEQPAAAATLAKRLLAVFANDFEVEDHRLKLGLSIGVAIYPTDGADAKALMVNADAALYRAKAEMRGTALFFEPEMGARLRERHALQEDLRSAIDRGELLLHYQPQFKMSGKIIGFEALVRWQCPKRGMVLPGTFIPIAEESGFIIPVGEWVLREACREAASWPQPLTIAVNISPIQFRLGDLPNLVHSILLETGLAPGRLELEITESVMINDFSHAVSILRRLKSLGVKIAMDDFGTGYSSLSYLQAFNCDKIKIDRVFICDLESNYHSRAIVRAVIGLGQSLKLPILAEGVETEGQHAHLVQVGCDEVQGYLTGRPLPIADYAKLVGRQATRRQKLLPIVAA